MNINQSLDKFVLKTLWLWLPFYAFFALIKEIGERGKHKH
jgi:hypothetical protein